MSTLMTSRCGFYLVYDGQRCDPDTFVAKDSKKIGVQKAMPQITKAVEGKRFLVYST